MPSERDVALATQFVQELSSVSSKEELEALAIKIEDQLSMAYELEDRTDLVSTLRRTLLDFQAHSCFVDDHLLTQCKNHLKQRLHVPLKLLLVPPHRIRSR